VSAKLIIAAGVLGASGVLLGALGAHALKDVLDADSRKGEAFATAVDYHLIHALAVLTLGFFARQGAGKTSRRSISAAWAMVSGVTIFSGSLYAWSLGGPSWLVHVTPFGGLTLIVGWLLVARVGLGLTRGRE